MITLHSAASTNFTSQGIGSLKDYVEGLVVEELNGQYELTLKYPISGVHFKELQLRRIIYCKPNPFSSPQPFRIYSISRPINRTVTVNASHISYDLSDYPVNEFSAYNAKDAFTRLKSNAQVPHPFEFNTTVTNTGEIKVEVPRSTRYVMGNNIKLAYEGDWEFDNFMVYYRQNRGMNRGVSVRYGKNLLDINQEENIANVYTGVYPYWAYTETTEENGTSTEKTVVVKLPEKIVNVEGNFDFTRILPLDLGEWFTNEQPTEQQMRDKTLEYIKKEKIGIPKISLEVSSVQLPGTLEEIYLGDTVLVEFDEVGINATARCIKTVYNIAKDRYDSVTFGEAKSNLSVAISDNNKVVSDKIEQQKIQFDAEVGSIKIDLAEIDLAIIDKANIDWVSANFAHLVNGYIDKAEINDATIGTAMIEDLAVKTAKIGLLAVDTAQINNLAVKTAKIDDLAVTNAKIKDLSAEKITAGDISADRIKVGVIDAINANIGTATINSAKIGNLNADKITAGDITSDRIKTNVITAINANIGNVKIDTAKIGDLNADKITAGDITSDRIKTNVITAINANIGNVKIDSAKIGNLNADQITAGDISADRIQSEVIAAINSYAGTAKIKQAKIDDLVVGSANITDLDVSKLTGGKIEASLIDVDKIYIKEANISGTITATKISGGTLDASKMTVKNLRADSITAGSITIEGENLQKNSAFEDGKNHWLFTSTQSTVDDTVKFEGINTAHHLVSAAGSYTSDSITYVYSGNNKIPASEGESFIASANFMIKSLTDTNSFIRLGLWFYKPDGSYITSITVDPQLTTLNSFKYVTCSGKAPAGTGYVAFILQTRGFADVWMGKPMLSRGTIASIWKRHNDELISDGAIDNDKLGNGSVSSDKLNVDELFVGNNAFIQSLKAIEIDAGQITTGKIRNEVIDISGLVTFESFAPEIKPLFSVQGDKTYINGGTIATNTIQANSIDLLSGITVKGPDNQNSFAISSNGEIEVNAWLHSTNYVEGVSGYSINRDGTAELNEVRVRGTFDAVDAGITNSIDDDDAIRIWAGGTYENRDVAKFRVNKRGDLFATDATLSGVLYGDLVNDNLTIDNGSVMIKNGLDNVVSISSGLTFLNTDLDIGNGSIRYTTGDKTFSLLDADFLVEGAQSNVLIDRSLGPLGGLNVIGPTGGHHILRGSTADNRLGTLVFDSEGNQGSIGDFSFTRKNYAERCKVHIDGDLKVGEKISSTTYPIEQRWIASGANEGIGFYVM